MNKGIKVTITAMLGSLLALATVIASDQSVNGVNGANDSGLALSGNVIKELDTSEYISCVGSVSKVYAVVAAMQLVEEGKLRLDAPVTDYLPEFEMADDRYRFITVSMLMDHTSGIMGTNRNNLTLYGDDDLSSFEGQLQNLSSQRLKANPGVYAAYCNDGFDVLALIIERVSGMTYTDYITTHIADRVGATDTGTVSSLYEDDNLVQLYSFGSNKSDFEYCSSLGAGGVYATASDMARFGSGFFTGNQSILSEESKAYMSRLWYDVEANATDTYDREYMAQSASGWDYARERAYEGAVVNVLGKGGDIDSQHAFLLVAPDEGISIGILSTGGSSFHNGLFAQALLDEVLISRGRGASIEPTFEIELASSISDDALRYEGYYVLADQVAHVQIQDDELRLYNLAEPGKDPDMYLPCVDGGFVKADDNGNISPEKEILYFEENADGCIYIKRDVIMELPSLGCQSSSSYAGQRIEANLVDRAAIEAWKAYDGCGAAIVNARYSAQIYDRPFSTIRLFDELPGYVVIDTQTGLRILRIKDEGTCEAFTTIPSDANRDLVDLQLGQLTLADGRDLPCFTSSDGTSQMLIKDMPYFTADIRSVQLTSNQAIYYQIGDDAIDASISITAPLASSVYVYNKYREIVYSSHIEGQLSDISLPKGGYILFIGQSGEEIIIN